MDKDAVKLAEMGYKPELKRHFSVWSVLGVGFGLTNSWFGISASLVTGISSGGPMIIVYGILIIACISTCIAITLSELCSAFPNSGGQYYWTTQIAPRQYAPFLAYLCGALAYVGAIFTSASVTLSLGQMLVGFYALGKPDFEPKPWMVFVTYQLLNAVLVVFNVYGRVLPHIAKMALYTSLFSFITITITVLICSRGDYQPAEFVFVDFDNNTGWSSAGIAFILGLINPNWSFSCLDSATHLAEEVAEPEKMIPIAIMATVAIGFTTSFCYVISMFFSIQNLQDILNSNTGAPIIDIYYQALNSRAGALVLCSLLFLTGVGCNISCHTWQARLGWSFARDNGLPFSRQLAQIDTRLGVPLKAHLASCALVAVVGALYMASSTAFNAFVTGCITFLLLSYAVPTVTMLIVGRDTIPRGPFWLGKIGFVANLVLVFWTLFALVFFSFPFEMPVTKDNMNYASVVIVGFVLYIVGYWKLYARHAFKTSEKAHLTTCTVTVEDSGSEKIA